MQERWGAGYGTGLGLLFGYLVFVRTTGLADNFWIYADQIRDWQIALRSFSDLPLVGPPSLAGGNTAGPSYYWLLWLIAQTIGPFVGDLPHAGGLGVATLQSGADVLLFHALARRLSPWVAAIVVLTVATATPDVAVSSTIWNPPVAIALAKTGIALAMMFGVERPVALGVVTALLWLAVQAHTTALPIAMAVIGYGLVARLERSRAIQAVTGRLAIVAVVIAVLQIPWLVHRTTVADAPASTPMGASVAAVIRDPVAALRPLDSVRSLSRAIHANTDSGAPEEIVAAVVVVGAAILLWRSRDGLVKAIAVGPLVAAVALYAVWQGSLAENYWYLALSTPAAICAVGWISAVGLRVGQSIALSLLALVAARHLATIEPTERPLRTPIYGALVKGSRAIVAAGYPVRDIRTTFKMPEGTDPAYVYSLLGGRLDVVTNTRALVGSNGRVEFITID
jgi:hypothetical protein